LAAGSGLGRRLFLDTGVCRILRALVEAGEHRIVDLLAFDQIDHDRRRLVAHLERPLADQRLDATLLRYCGLLIAYLEIPPFVVTLGMLSIARGLAMVASNNTVAR